MGQTVNLVALPSQVRILLPPVLQRVLIVKFFISSLSTAGVAQW